MIKSIGRLVLADPGISRDANWDRVEVVDIVAPAHRPIVKVGRQRWLYDLEVGGDVEIAGGEQTVVAHQKCFLHAVVTIIRWGR